MTSYASEIISTLRPESPEKRTRRVLVLSSVFPSIAQPTYGVFVKERIRALAGLPNYDVRVVSPTPWFPPVKAFPRWYPWSQTPRQESIAGLSVDHPRYILPPKLGGYLHPRLMYRAARRAILRLRRGFDFDFIDAHFVWPNGALAARLSREFGKPFVITGRGEDMLRFPSLPVIRNGIRAAVKDASCCIALSREIANAFRDTGASEDRIAVVPNGVDGDLFQPQCQNESRSALGLPTDRRIVLAVGDLQERKGFHLLVEAVAKIRRQFPDILAVIVGGPPRSGPNYRPIIEAAIRQHQVADHVRLVGPSQHAELPRWYSAADRFVLLSSREGSPNALLEALACGLPVVATPVGETVDLLADSRLGILMQERSSDSAADAIQRSLSQTWDRHAIREFMQTRSWMHVARKLDAIYDRVLGETHGYSRTDRPWHRCNFDSSGCTNN